MGKAREAGWKATYSPQEQFTNGLSDYDAQILILHNKIIENSRAHNYTKRLINEFTVSEFKLNLC